MRASASSGRRLRCLGASPQAAAPTEEPPVPAAGARVTASQVQAVRQTAIAVAAEDQEMAPEAISVADRSVQFGEAIRMISPEATAPETIDPRTGKPWLESSVFVVTLEGQFTVRRHVPYDQPIPTGTHLSLAIDVASGKVVSTYLGSIAPALPEVVTAQ
jgi:hypothetical protein